MPAGLTPHLLRTERQPSGQHDWGQHNWGQAVQDSVHFPACHLAAVSDCRQHGVLLPATCLQLVFQIACSLPSVSLEVRLSSLQGCALLCNVLCTTVCQGAVLVFVHRCCSNAAAMLQRNVQTRIISPLLLRGFGAGKDRCRSRGPAQCGMRSLAKRGKHYEAHALQQALQSKYCKAGASAVFLRALPAQWPQWPRQGPAWPVPATTCGRTHGL